MSKINSKRKSCKDVFNAFLVSVATYAGTYELPKIRPTYYIPNRLISFSKAISSKDNNQWIHFFEEDYLFERIWRNPKRYLKIIRRFNGVILPDFSLYRDMPLAMQIWNIYRSRAIGYWFQRNGIRVIPNIRFGDNRTYNICCDGIEKYCTIAVGAHGNIKNADDREIFLKGIDHVIRKLEPTVVVIYGFVPEKYIQKYQKSKIRIIQFDSDYAAAHEEVV